MKISWPMLNFTDNTGAFYYRGPAITFKAEPQARQRHREEFRDKARLEWADTTIGREAMQKTKSKASV